MKRCIAAESKKNVSERFKYFENLNVERENRSREETDDKRHFGLEYGVGKKEAKTEEEQFRQMEKKKK